MLRRGIATLLWALSTTPAYACPICATDTGQQVREGIFNGSFGTNLVLTLLPFPILIGIILAIYFRFPGMPRSAPRRMGNQAEGASRSTHAR